MIFDFLLKELIWGGGLYVSLTPPGGNVKTPKTGKLSGKRRKLRENGRISSDRTLDHATPPGIEKLMQ